MVDMQKQKISHHGRTYKYILSLMDVFSRFHWLCPLETKHSQGIKHELKKIYDLNGIPEILQSDNGKEFKGSVKSYCTKNKIRMVQSRPYNPKAQGKVERSHRALRKKMMYDLMTQKKSGVNWVKNLPQYMKALNNDKREELGWRSPFEVYFGRKSNEMLKCGISERQGTPEIATALPGSKNDYQKSEERIKNLRKDAHCNDKRIAERTVQYYKKKHACSTYKVHEKVLIRYGKRGKRASKRQYVLLGDVLKVGKQSDNYKIKFRLPETGKITTHWFSVEDIADFKGKSRKENDKEKKSAKNEKTIFQSNLRIPLKRKDHVESFNSQGYQITYDPNGDGNCQFSAFSHVLKQFGIHLSASKIRQKVVQYLENNDLDDNGWPLELFVGMPFSHYLMEMASEGTYGDELTLRVMVELFNVELTVVSTLGHNGQLTITPREFEPQGRVILGHFAEGQGYHYVVLSQIENDVNESHIDFQFESQVHQKNESDNEDSEELEQPVLSENMEEPESEATSINIEELEPNATSVNTEDLEPKFIEDLEPKAIEDLEPKATSVDNKEVELQSSLVNKGTFK